VVRIQTTQYSTGTDAKGEFLLSVPESIVGTARLTAWAEGYFIGGPVEASLEAKEMTILLQRHALWDNHNYAWVPAVRPSGSAEKQACSECHLRGDEASGPALPVDEWLQDAQSVQPSGPGKDMPGLPYAQQRGRHFRAPGLRRASAQSCNARRPQDARRGSH